MKKISQSNLNLVYSHGPNSTRTGFHCPRNGFWRPEGGNAEPLFVFEGSLMPTHGGSSTVWLLVDTSSAVERL